MKRIIFLLTMVLGLVGQMQAQKVEEADLKKLLSSFKEYKKGDKIDAATVLKSINEDIEQKLAWQLLGEEIGEVSEAFYHPIGYYMRNDNVAVLIYCFGEKGNSVFYRVDMITYHIKKAKKIDRHILVDSFDDKGSSALQIRILPNAAVVIFEGVSLIGQTKIRAIISEKGSLEMDEM